MFKNANETDYNNKKSRHISNVYLLLAISFIPSFIGVLIGVPVLKSNIIVFSNWLMLGLGYLVLSILLIILIIKNRRNKIGYFFLLIFTFFSGLFLSPTLIIYTKNGSEIVIQSIVMVFIIFICMSFLSKFVKNVDKLGYFLFIWLINVIFAGIFIYFFHSKTLNLVYSSISVILFSLYIMYDTKKLTEDIDESPIIPVLSLYLDILNLFVSILGILKK